MYRRGLHLLLLAAVVLPSLANVKSQHSRVKRIVGGNPAQIPPRQSDVAEEATPAPAPPPTPRPQEQPGQRPAEPGPRPQSNPAIVVKDRRVAVLDGIHNPDGSYSFLGIRYAEPPVKRSRFLRPRRLKLKGNIDAKKFGPPCPQWYRGRVIGSEDCLFLNVFTPELPRGDGSPPPAYPVLVWIHGGNFQSGSAAQYIPTDIVRKGVVVVTLQYRLGSLGFLSLGRKELPGNVGLFDIALANRWVKDYIRFFGGDPRRIIPSGQGSGGSCASFLAMNRMMRNNIKGVFSMSGTPVSPFTLDESEVRTAKEVAEVDGCTEETETRFIRCMQNLPLETVLKGDSGVKNSRENRFDYAKKMSNILVPGPVEEGKDDSRFLPNFLVESPLDSLKKGNFPKIPLLTGITKQETGVGVKKNLFDEIKNLLSPSFLKGALFKDLLQANTGLYVNKTVNPSLSKLFDSGEYLQFFTNVVSSVLGELDQVVQHSTDAFFSLPAFLTSLFWSKRNKAFLYSFEHKGPANAQRFLQGIPLVSSDEQQENNEPCHGDDLAYLFDIRSLEGKPLENATELSESDKKVRDHFTSMVAEFARSGTPKTADGQTWSPFSKDEGSYMVIKEAPSAAKGFRKCSMGLWTGDSDMLNSVECSLGEASKIVTNTLGAAGTQLLSTVGSLEGRLGDTAGQVQKQTQEGIGKVTDTLTNPGGLVGLGGGGQKDPQKNTGSLLGGLTGGASGNKGSLLGLGSATPATSPNRGGSILGLGGSNQGNSNNKGSFFGFGK